MRRRNYILICLPFVVVGIVVALHGLMRMHQARQSLGWPMVAGEIVAAEVEGSQSMEGEHRFTPVIHFSYRVDGIKYESDHCTFGVSGRQTVDEAQGLVDAFKNRPSFSVYYNPENPESAVLLPGDASGLGVFVGTGGIFIVLGLLALVRGFLFARRFGDTARDTGRVVRHGK